MPKDIEILRKLGSVVVEGKKNGHFKHWTPLPDFHAFCWASVEDEPTEITHNVRTARDLHVFQYVARAKNVRCSADYNITARAPYTLARKHDDAEDAGPKSVQDLTLIVYAGDKFARRVEFAIDSQTGAFDSHASYVIEGAARATTRKATFEGSLTLVRE